MNLEAAKTSGNNHPVSTRSSGVMLVHASLVDAIEHLDANPPYHNVLVNQEFDFGDFEKSLTVFVYLTKTRDAHPAHVENLTRNAKRAVAKYGLDVCMKAFALTESGDGARTVACEFGFTTGQADAAINAGRELAR